MSLKAVSSSGFGGGFAASNTIWVDVNGNDSTAQRGNPAFPAATIYKGLSLATTGDLVQVGPGNFNLGTTTGISSITSAGTGYVVGDVVTFSNANIISAPTFQVATIGGGGAVTSLTLLTTGYGNAASAFGSISPTGGSGTGLAAVLTAVNAQVPNGVFLNGSGRGITVLKNGGNDQRGTYVSCRANGRVANLTIQTPSTSNTYAFPIGVDTLTGDTNLGTGNVVWNVDTTGWSDGAYYRNDTSHRSASGWTFYDCTFTANFDTFNIFENDPGAGAWPLTVDFYNCIFNARALANDTNAPFIRGIAVTDSSGAFVVTLHGGQVTVANATGNTSSYRACIAHDTSTPWATSANGGTFATYGTKLICPTAANSFSWRSSGGSSGGAVLISGVGTQYDTVRTSIATGDSFSTANLISFAQTANKTIANTVTETSLFGTGSGSLTLPANFFAAMRSLRLTLGGIISTTGTPTVRIQIKIGSTTIADSGTVTLLTSALANNYFAINALITCRTAGASGTVITSGKFTYDTSTAAANIIGIITTAAVTIDTTSTQALDVTFIWGTASASNTITNQLGLLENLNNY